MNHTPKTQIRIAAIQILCLLLMQQHPSETTPDTQNLLTDFEAIGGFAVMCDHLGKYLPDVHTCDALLGLIMGKWLVHHPSLEQKSTTTLALPQV